jgi:1-phosphofructokinase family hexose kinase
MIYTITLNPSIDLQYTIQAFAFNEVLRAQVVRRDLGGKGFNVSHALSCLKIENVALGFVGGKTGEFMVEKLSELKLENDLIWISGESRTNTSIIQSVSKEHLKVNDPGPKISPLEQTSLLKKVENRATEGDWFVLSGSLPPGVPLNFYAALIRLIQSKGARAALDTSGAPLRLGIKSSPFLIKPNRMEMQELTGLSLDTPTEYSQAITAAHDLGAKNMCLSLGKEGAVYSDGEKTWKAAPPSIDECNPIAAGDALLAGLVAALSQGQSCNQALAWGVACGAAAASLGGTAFGTLDEVDALFHKVSIT